MSGERPRSEGAVLGVRMIRYSGAQGTAMIAASLLQLVLLFVVAHYLGPAELGRFAVLFFGAGLMAQLLSIAVKPGTIRRTFAEGDDEDEEDEDADASESPLRSLGTGLALALLIAVGGASAAIALREPLADVLVGSRDDGDLVVWAAVLGAATVVFRLVSIVIWFERRPGAFLACEIARPVLTLGAVTALLAGGAGLESVLIGATAGTALAAVVGMVILRGSFEPALDRSEVGPILHVGLLRAPIMMSFWLIVNADVFLLSRFVDDAELGVYTLASRVGFLAAFLPQGFRVAMRPLRKAAVYQAVEDQYGREVQRGQLLGYFVLLCVSAVFALTLAAPVVADIAPDSFDDLAPLIPVTAAGMVLPALLRTVNQTTAWPSRTRATFIGCAVLSAALFIAATLLLAPELGNYAAPVGMMVGIVPPCLYLFVRGQRGPKRIAFPYREVGIATLVAAALGGGFAALPSMPVPVDLAMALAFGGLYLLLLVVLRVIPETHWQALTHMVRSLASGRPDRFSPRRGLRALEQPERDALRRAVHSSWAARARPEAIEADGGGDPGTLTGWLRRAGERGGVPVGAATDLDPAIGEYLFSPAPTAVRNASLRGLLAEGASAADLRALEDLVAHLATIPDDAWTGVKKATRR